MSLTVASVAQDVSYDIRQQLGVSGTDLTILTGFIDRIHKDCLHTSLYEYLNLATQPVNTIINQATYTLTGNIRRIIGVYDTTRDRILFPIDRATSPVMQAEHQKPDQPTPMGGYTLKFNQPPTSAISLQTSQPEYFRLLASNVLRLYPSPKAILALSVSTEQQVVTLVNPSDNLVIPEDGRDMIVAGADYLACLFLKRNEEAQVWAQIYQQLKAGQGVI